MRVIRSEVVREENKINTVECGNLKHKHFESKYRSDNVNRGELALSQ